MAGGHDSIDKLISQSESGASSDSAKSAPKARMSSLNQHSSVEKHQDGGKLGPFMKPSLNIPENLRRGVEDMSAVDIKADKTLLDMMRSKKEKKARPSDRMRKEYEAAMLKKMRKMNQEKAKTTKESIEALKGQQSLGDKTTFEEGGKVSKPKFLSKEWIETRKDKADEKRRMRRMEKEYRAESKYYQDLHDNDPDEYYRIFDPFPKSSDLVSPDKIKKHRHGGGPLMAKDLEDHKDTVYEKNVKKREASKKRAKEAIYRRKERKRKKHMTIFELEREKHLKEQEKYDKVMENIRKERKWSPPKYKKGGEVKKTGKKNDPADKGIKEYYEKKAKERGPADLPLVKDISNLTEKEARAIMADEHPYKKGSDLYKHEVWSVDSPAPTYPPAIQGGVLGGVGRKKKKKKKK